MPAKKPNGGAPAPVQTSSAPVSVPTQPVKAAATAASATTTTASVTSGPAVTQAAGAGAKRKPVTKKPVPQVQAVASSPATTTSKDEPSGGEVLIADLLDKFTALSLQFKQMQTSLKLLAKEYDKQKKIIDKVQKKKEKAKKSPSGFAKPCKISDELCEFIGIPKGTEQSRTDITRFINSYVKEHNLNNPQNRREFFPDKKLKSILNVKDGEKVTYFVLQRLIAHHFPPSMSKLAAAAKAS